jgi:hypothetical protein
VERGCQERAKLPGERIVWAEDIEQGDHGFAPGVVAIAPVALSQSEEAFQRLAVVADRRGMDALGIKGSGIVWIRVERALRLGGIQ